MLLLGLRTVEGVGDELLLEIWVYHSCLVTGFAQ